MLQFLITMYAAKKAELDERGASAVEYGLLVAGIAAVMITVIYAFYDNLAAIFTGTGTKIGSKPS